MSDDREQRGLVGRAWELGCAAHRAAGLPDVRPPADAKLTADERRAWAQFDHDYQAGTTPELRAYRAAIEGVMDHHDRRAVRWLEVLEQHRAERRLAILAEADELDREIDARIAELTKDAAA